MGISLVVREAGEQDADALAPFIDDLGYAITPAAFRARLPAFRASGAEMLVLEIDGVPAGCCSISMMTVIHRPAPVGRISMIVIDPARRGKGLGAQLVAAAEAELRRRGCGMIEVTSGNSRDRAHRFYEGLGYADTSRRFSKDAPIQS